METCVVGIPNASEGEGEREAADVGERSQKGTCAWGDIAFTHS